MAVGKLLLGEYNFCWNRGEDIPQNPVRAVTDAGFAQRTIQYHPESVGVGMFAAEKLRGSLRAHGMGRGGANADLVDFADRFH